MKKGMIVSILLVVFSFMTSSKIDAASNTFVEGVKSPYYSGTMTGYTHLGYSREVTSDMFSQTIVYSDLLLRDYYKVTYSGILGSPQATYYEEFPVVVINPQKISIDQLSFFMSEELIHTDRIQLSFDMSINDIESQVGVAWQRVTRWSQGVKITVEVGENYAKAPLVAMVIYKVEARFYEVKHTGSSTRTFPWQSFPNPTTFTKTTSYVWATVGYAAYYTYLGDGNDNDYKSGLYLINNHPNFSSTYFKTY